ncbi:hypothetical protein BJY21_000900 [Kineosphaera limosa]|uniref:three-helix bundle dimerization domain-containing protein n=1 Tax=Kineosphaera limosa TaxID=111564 RepID=UPI00058FBEFC|nr:hypothetical protein [Kineosphaera limosa]NYD99715.1 hypothetical protein [Kineosphaera limosa]
MSSSPVHDPGWEQAAVEHVVDRLQERYEGVPTEIVETVVRRAHAEFDGPIRDFVPLLVEKAARGRLDELQRRVAVDSAPTDRALVQAPPVPA